MVGTSVSLPTHLRDRLLALRDILPSDIILELSPILNDDHSYEISYSILLNISKWARSDEARSQLQVKSLEHNDYTIISMLAGTITSPSSNFPPYVPPPDPAVQARKGVDDRKAIVAILNGVLSMGCVGYAGWWASGSSGWRDEWRALFAVFVALIVGISEGGLYIIWQSRKESSGKTRQTRKRRKFPTSNKKTEDNNGTIETEVVSADKNILYLRKRLTQVEQGETAE